MSWRQWAQGEIVEAGDLQDLVQNQVIQSYETELQRDNTLGANVIEGMFCYVEETGNFQLYDGFDWITINVAAGTITEVAAGDGLTGGGTTGSVTLAADMTFINANASITASQISDVTSTAAELNILDGVTSTAAELNILDGVTSTAAELNTLDGITATTAELNFTDGVTSNIQTQLDGKVDEVNGTVTTAATSSTVVRNITLATTEPLSTDGIDGDVWLVYTA